GKRVDGLAGEVRTLLGGGDDPPRTYLTHTLRMLRMPPAMAPPSRAQSPFQGFRRDLAEAGRAGVGGFGRDIWRDFGEKEIPPAFPRKTPPSIRPTKFRKIWLNPR